MKNSFKLGLYTALSLFTFVSAGSAVAADFAAESYDWTGLYLGVYGGGGAIVDNIEVPPLGGANLNGLGGEGLLGGVLAGYNYQMNNIVFGLQGELGFNDLHSELNVPGLLNIDARQGFVAALSARAGLLLTSDTLAYIIGGYSYSDYKLSSNAFASIKENYDGFHVGGGLETRVGSNTTLRAEYRYTSYSGEDWGAGPLLNIEPSSHTGTVALAYNFGGGSGSNVSAPAVASDGSDWTGLYLGVYGGGGAIVDNIEIPPLAGANLNGLGGEGLLGGLMAGYNYQMDNFVVGLQGEVGFNDLRSELNVPGLLNIDARQGFVAALSARAGWLFTPDAMAYVIGGYSYSDYKLSSNAFSSIKETYDGFHVGGGLEAKVTANTTLRAEYRYASYSGEDWGAGPFLNIEPSSHTGTVGLAYMF